MNAQDAITAISGAEDKNGEVQGVITEVETFCNETEATLAELLGHDNESVGLFSRASERLATCKELCARLGTEMEAAREYLQSIE